MAWELPPAVLFLTLSSGGGGSAAAPPPFNFRAVALDLESLVTGTLGWSTAKAELVPVKRARRSGLNAIMARTTNGNYYSQNKRSDLVSYKQTINVRMECFDEG
jgi:hypothetical protein